MELFDRNIKVWGRTNQSKIHKTSVLIGGIGGLGSIVAEILVRSGIGRLIIIDYEKINAPDLNRQILYTKENIGEYKVDIATEELNKIGTSCNIIPINRKIVDKPEFYREIKELDFSIVIDCLDNYKSRFTFEKILNEGQYLISGGVSNTFGQVITIKKGTSMSLSTIYEGLENEKAVGVVPQVVLNIASIMANECIKCIIGKPILLNRFLVIDLENYDFDFIDIEGVVNE